MSYRVEVEILREAYDGRLVILTGDKHIAAAKRLEAQGLLAAGGEGCTSYRITPKGVKAST